jgi:hypothetical protein
LGENGDIGLKTHFLPQRTMKNPKFQALNPKQIQNSEIRMIKTGNFSVLCRPLRGL